MRLDVVKRETKTGMYVEVVRSFELKDKNDEKTWNIANKYARKKNKSFLGKILNKYYYDVEFNPE